MRKTKVVLMAQTILQLDAGSYEAIIDGEDTYILLHQTEGLGDGDSDDVEVAKTPTQKPKAKTEAKVPVGKAQEEESDEETSASWSEDDMKEMPTEELMAEIEALDIPLAKKGRNTNAKLRNAILDFYASGEDVADDSEEEEEEESAPRRGRAKPKASREPVEIPEEEWDDLNKGDTVIAKLLIEGEEGDKLWEAEIVGWRKPKGVKEEHLYVLFTEDGMEDFLRDGDKLFEFREEI